MVEDDEAQVPSFDFISYCKSNDSANQQGPHVDRQQTIKRFAPIHRVKHGKLHDDLTQIILPLKTNEKMINIIGNTHKI